MAPPVSGAGSPDVLPRVLIAGHKLDFFAPIAAMLRDRGHLVAEDRWRGRERHDEASSRELLDWADVIVCEFCLGNAIWYAQHKRPGQRLVVHFHRFELDTDYPAELAVDAVDHVAFAGPHIRDAAIERFGWPPERCLYVANGVDVERYDRPKRDGAAHTLGLLGYHRRLKRLDLALDVLEDLRREDRRFRLLAKGPDPETIWWVWKHDREYFEQLYARIEDSEHLDGAVRFDGYDDRVAEWLTGVGFILSTSDVESFHLAAAEGAASGAVPLVRRREGAAEIFTDRWVFDSPQAMAAFAAELVRSGRWPEEGVAASRHIEREYDLGLVLAAWRALLFGTRLGIDARERSGTRS